MRVSQVMARDAVTTTPHTAVAEAAELIVRHGLAVLPVVALDGGLAGVVTDVDLLRALTDDPGHRTRTVGDVMTRGVTALAGSDDVGDVARTVLDTGIAGVPVVLDGRVSGIVSRLDVLHGLLAGAHAGGAADGDDPDGDDPGGDDTDREGLRVLDLTQCLRRLRSTPVGRVAYLSEGDPLILPVNHGVDGSTVVFRTREGSKLLAAERAASIAFEADGYDPVRRYGWSVLVRGSAEAVYGDDDAVARYESLGIDSWADARSRTVWVRVRATDVSGREIVR